MALFDSVDCLAGVRLLAGRDKLSADASMTDANWYALLTAAEAVWKPKLAGQYPYHMFTAPTLMTTADNGVTYTFGSDGAPLAVEVYSALNGDRLRVGQFGDSAADYVWEGDNIRMPMNTIRSWSAGAPYARYVAGPTTIDGSTEPTMLPKFTRRLIIIRAVLLWAARGGMRDTQSYRDLEDETWRDVQEALKQSNPFYGDSANRGSRRVSGIAYLLGRR